MDFDDFYCVYCGASFGNDPIKLSLHIRDSHEQKVD